MVVESDHPTLGRLRTLGSPIKMSETPPSSAAARRCSASTREVLREAGYSEDEIAAIAAPHRWPEPSGTGS